MAYKFTLLFYSSLLLIGCDNEPSSPNNNATELSHVYSYTEQTLETPLRYPASCVNYTNNCTVAELPFIAMSYPDTKIAEVMSRVVVSHDWMGERFESLLTLLPNEILILLGSVTAVVISNNIRPSFYWTGSGAIYLDPATLWLTNEEKSTINQTPDYRDAFANGLKYDFFHRFVKDNRSAYSYHSLTGNEERSIDDILLPMASLLFHELAHANDFMPSTLMPSLNIENKTWSEINRFSSQRLNIKLKQSYPISNTTLTAHAAVLYLGAKATEQQKQDNASDLGILMQQEGANHLYAYSHQAEDVAMLFQATMLNYYYDIKMDSAFVIQPETGSFTCNDYIVAWGQRHRIADAISRPRALFVSQQLLPSINFSLFFSHLEAPQPFPLLTDWCNISLTESLTTNGITRARTQPSRQKIKRDHHHGMITAFQ
ncbi:hypothetical protein [Psychromonas hadalis]|uniref:hypothetical protein n=1 Tax=Psychromonas hadalis TaxID=211669 RepID=UPI0003B521DA|nr:hypothetical protein [Psychromonas hadalis]